MQPPQVTISKGNASLDVQFLVYLINTTFITKRTSFINVVFLDRKGNVEERSIHPALLLCILHFIVTLCVWSGIGQLGHFLSSMDHHHPCLYLNCSQHFDLYKKSSTLTQSIVIIQWSLFEMVRRPQLTPVLQADFHQNSMEHFSRT